jgi:DNA polymerase-3 subunit alpha (Gram-positive type)
MRLSVSFGVCVAAEVIKELEKKIENSSLGISSVRISPLFPKETFCENAFEGIAAELKRRDASINGTLKDCEIKYKNNILLISLAHGGLELLNSRKADMAIASIIKEQYDTDVKVEFSGVTTIESMSETSVASIEKEQIKKDRERIISEIDSYEAMLLDEDTKKERQKKAGPKTINKREGSFLMPQIDIDTQKELFGRMPKGKIVPIYGVSTEDGKVTIWGEIFSLESKTTRDNSRKIYTIMITDYTSSVTLKLLLNINRIGFTVLIFTFLSMLLNLIHIALFYNKGGR